jgi:hypothetical protein
LAGLVKLIGKGHGRMGQHLQPAGPGGQFGAIVLVTVQTYDVLGRIHRNVPPFSPQITCADPNCEIVHSNKK